jgi:hypothetical protein
MATEIHPPELAAELDRDAGLELLDEAAHRYLGINGEEFVRAWDAGKFEDPDRPEVMRVAMLLPFAR